MNLEYNEIDHINALRHLCALYQDICIHSIYSNYVLIDCGRLFFVCYILKKQFKKYIYVVTAFCLWRAV